MAEWPVVAELQRRLDFEPTGEEDPAADILARDLASAIARVKLDVGNWVEEDDEPDDSLANAALRMAELIATRPDADPTALSADPTYRRLLFGHRRVFGVA